MVGGYDAARAEIDAVIAVRRRHGVQVDDRVVDDAVELLCDMWQAAAAMGPDFGGDTPLMSSLPGVALDAVSDLASEN